MLTEALQTFIQVLRVTAYISTIISAAANKSPDAMMFPCGSTLFINFPNKNVQNITEIAEINVSLCELFQKRMS